MIRGCKDKLNIIIMNKLLDWLLKVFMRVFEIFLYSLILPFVLFIALLLGEVANRINNLLIPDYPYIYFGISIAVGVCLKIWRDEISTSDNYKVPFHSNIVKWLRAIK